jgi:S23 ribosomal protein.
MQLNFERLEVYKDAIEFANQIYETTKSFPKSETFGISNQLRRASISIPSNIAEGSTRGKKNSFISLTLLLAPLMNVFRL